MKRPFATLFRLLIGLWAAGLIITFEAKAQPDYAPAHWVPPACNKYYTTGNGRHFLVIHDMEGYYLSSISYLNRCDQDTNGNYNVSASIHYCVNGVKNGSDEDGHSESDTSDAAAGDITQSVRESRYAWHARCLNQWSFGTEHEGFVSSPVWYTETMYLASAALQRHLADVYGVPKDRNHIVGHGEWQNATWVAWMSTNYPSIDPSCNTHTDPGIYWNWSHFMDLVNGQPGINRQPWSRAVDRGSNATFTVSVLGSTPLSYQWRKNGANIAGATASSYTINGVQPANAAGYSCVITNTQGAITSRVALLTVNPVWVQAFADDLNSNSAANWNLYWGAGNGIMDFTTNWAFNFSNVTYIANGATNLIPAAPNSSGSKLALKISVNKNDATAATAGVSLYPKNLVFSNAYSLRFDAWINYNGSAGGGSGSTEYLTCGLNHTGTRVNWLTGTASDGLWFAVDGEGGSGGNDYRAFLGTGGAPTELAFTNTGFAASGTASANVRDDFYEGLFPAPTWESGGAPGKKWVQVELSQIGNLVTWQLNGVVIAQRTNTSVYTSGDAMIGYMDPFTSIANPGADNFLLLENVRVLMGATLPTISAQPLSQTNHVSSNATFTVAATGLPSPTYQWRFNGTNIIGATASAYTRASLTMSDAGGYSALVTNVAGSVTSSVAQLTVTVPVPPVIGSVAIVGGNQVQFAVSGEAGTSLTIWRSDDLTNWVPVTNFPNPTGTIQFSENLDLTISRRFYRAAFP